MRMKPSRSEEARQLRCLAFVALSLVAALYAAPVAAAVIVDSVRGRRSPAGNMTSAEPQRQSRSLAIRAPSASALNFAQTTDGTTGLSVQAKVAKPQSAPATTRSRPTMLA